MPRLISQGAARQFLASLPSVTLFDVGRRRQRFDTNGAAVVSLVMESGLSRQQADALAYLFHCGGKLSWVDLSYTKMKTRTFDALERRALVG